MKEDRLHFAHHYYSSTSSPNYPLTPPAPALSPSQHSIGSKQICVPRPCYFFLLGRPVETHTPPKETEQHLKGRARMKWALIITTGKGWAPLQQKVQTIVVLSVLPRKGKKKVCSLGIRSQAGVTKRFCLRIHRDFGTYARHISPLFIASDNVCMCNVLPCGSTTRQGCKVWTYTTTLGKNEACWMKTTAGGTIHRAGHTSGHVTLNYPPHLPPHLPLPSFEWMSR